MKHAPCAPTQPPAAHKIASVVVSARWQQCQEPRQLGRFKTALQLRRLQSKEELSVRGSVAARKKRPQRSSEEENTQYSRDTVCILNSYHTLGSSVFQGGNGGGKW
jgi:hypothetical protein